MGNSTTNHLKSLGYDPQTTGLGAIAQGIQQARQQNLQNSIAQQQLQNQTTQLGYENPNRTPSQLDILKSEGGNPLQNAMAQLLQSAGKLNQPTTQASPAPAQASGTATQTPPTTPVAVTPWDPNTDQYYQANFAKAKASGASGYDPDKQKFFTYH